MSRMKKTEITKLLNTWFRLENYNGLSELTLEELRRETYNRMIMFRTAFAPLSLSFSPDIDELAKNTEEAIFSGHPLVSHLRLPEHAIASDDHVQLLNMTDLNYWDRRTRRGNTFPRDERGVLILTNENAKTPVSECLNSGRGGMMYVKFDLSDSSDEEIIESMKAILPRWRKLYRMKDDKIGSFRFGISTIRKLIDYRIIPLLDLMFWEKMADINLTFSYIERVLYPDNDEYVRESPQIKDTDKPLALRTLDKEFQRLFYLFINKNNHLKDSKVDGVLKEFRDET